MFVAVGFGSGVAATLELVVVGAVVASGFEFFAERGFVFSDAGLSGRANCEDMIAGSTGAPLTVEVLVGVRLAGGVYFLAEEFRGGKSCCLRTPLYL